jgi:hypothetical protein
MSDKKIVRILFGDGTARRFMASEEECLPLYDQLNHDRGGFLGLPDSARDDGGVEWLNKAFVVSVVIGDCDDESHE